MSKLRIIIIALAALMAAGLSAPAQADSGRIRIQFLKAGWIIGGAAGSGVLEFRGRLYPITVGGLSYGFTFGGSQTSLHGRVTNIFSPSDIEGVYGAAGAGATIIRGPQAIPDQILTDSGRVELPRAPDGHYYATLTVNGVDLRFMADTGASTMVLTQADARAIGLDPDTLLYLGQAYTANGVVRTARVTLDSVAFGPFADSGVSAASSTPVPRRL